MTEAPAPIGIDEARRLLAPLRAYRLVVVAVSGGPDSMALLHLMAEWDGCAFAAVTIDHDLRAGSKTEAKFVADVARRLRVPHMIARWGDAKPATGIPAAAREARYGYLCKLCEGMAEPGTPTALVTAHTQDDQAETLLMRLKRGSGLEGLAAMAPERALAEWNPSIHLMRPLLNVPKARLIATLRAKGEGWVEDPTNSNTRFERPRLRALLTQMQEEGFEASAIARSARRLRAAEEGLIFGDSAFEQKVALKVHNEIFAALETVAFHQGPRILRERLITRLIARFGGCTAAPRLSEVEDVVERLETCGELRVTLGGAVISQGLRSIRVWREEGRIKERAFLTAGDEPRLWDNRFWVSVAEPSPERVSVERLGLSGLAVVKQKLADRDLPPSRAAAALPAFYLAHRLIGVPGLSYQEPGFPRVNAAVAYRD